MLNKIIILTFLTIPLGLMAQFDDPFGNPNSGGGGDDPFGDPTPTQQPNRPADNNAPVTIEEAAPDISDPYPEVQPSTPGDGSGNLDPFSSGNDVDAGFNDPNSFGPDGTANAYGDGTLFDNMVDTLTPPLVPDYPWEQNTIKERQLLAPSQYRESDIFWAKTVYREIDIREKMNHPFANPRAPFMTVLLNILDNNPDIPIYKEDIFTGQDFSEATYWDSVETTLGNKRTEVAYDEDENGNIIERNVDIVDKFRVSKVRRFALKEVWFFDKKHSTMRVEIMGIAPLYEVSAADQGADALLLQQMGMDNMTTTQTLFWVYYPDIRPFLGRYETYNPLNDAVRMSWEDFLTARYFASYITKASNPLNQRIQDYTRNSLDALYESERVKEEIFNFEHDLWSY